MERGEGFKCAICDTYVSGATYTTFIHDVDLCTKQITYSHSYRIESTHSFSYVYGYLCETHTKCFHGVETLHRCSHRKWRKQVVNVLIRSEERRVGKECS